MKVLYHVTFVAYGISYRSNCIDMGPNNPVCMCVHYHGGWHGNIKFYGILQRLSGDRFDDSIGYTDGYTTVSIKMNIHSSTALGETNTG